MDTFQPKLPLKSEDSTLHHSTSTSSVLSAAAKEFVPSFLNKTESTLPVFSDKDIEDGESKQCARCSKIFYVTSEGQYLTKEGCTYHWGKLRTNRRKDRWPEDDRYTCCGASASESQRVSSINLGETVLNWGGKMSENEKGTSLLHDSATYIFLCSRVSYLLVHNHWIMIGNIFHTVEHIYLVRNHFALQATSTNVVDCLLIFFKSPLQWHHLFTHLHPRCCLF